MKKEEYTEKADVYSYGIIMWELVVREKPFDEYEVARSAFTSQLEDAIIAGLRPTFPDDTVPEYEHLASDCWKGDPKLRPTFEEICKRLTEAAQLVRRYQADGEGGGNEGAGEEGEEEEEEALASTADSDSASPQGATDEASE